MTFTPSSPPTAVDGMVQQGARAWLDWFAAMGADDPVPSLHPVRTAPAVALLPPAAPTPAVLPTPRVQMPQVRGVSGEREGVLAAQRMAQACQSLAEIEQALERFEGCSLRSTATRLCFADGQPDARVMLIGEAPGTEEDRQGKPFV